MTREADRNAVHNGPFVIGPFVLDLAGPELSRQGKPVPIRAKPLLLLAALARRAGQIVSKERLIGEVWPGTAVSDASLATALRELRRALGDDGSKQRFIETLRHRGYRLRIEVAAHAPSAGDDAEPSGRDSRAFELLSSLGATLFETGRHEEARAAYREAVNAARGEGDDTRFVLAALRFAGGIANTETAVHSPERVALLEEAAQRDAAVAPGLRARLRARLAINLLWTRRDEAIGFAREARALAAACEDPASSARVLYDVYWVLWSPENLDERIALATEMMQDAQRADDRLASGFAALLLAAARLEAGQRAEAEASARRSFEWMQELQQPGLATSSASWRAAMALLDGRFADAERHAQDALAGAREFGGRNGPAIYAAQLMAMRLDQGRGAELGALVSEFPAEWPLFRAAAALVRFEAGDSGAAQVDFDVAMSGFAELPRDWEWLPTGVVCAEVAVRLEDVPAAERLYLALLPHEAQCAVAGLRSLCRGSVALYLGLLARTCGRSHAVIPHLEAAVRSNTRLRALPLLARSELELARSLVERAGRGDHLRARHLLRESADLHRGLGIAHWQPEVAALLDRTGSAR